MPSESGPNQVIELIVKFNDALNRHDVTGMLDFLTPDSLFENTDPPPDGIRIQGQEHLNAFWQEFFQSAQDQRIEIEEIFAVGDRCVMRWVYFWKNPDTTTQHIRGVDLYRVRDGKIAEKLSYVKG